MRDIINFMSAVLEDTNDPFITSKVSIHINQDMLLTRMNDIYKLFELDIKKSMFGIGEVMKMVNIVQKMKTKKKTKSRKSLGSGGSKKKKGFTLASSSTVFNIKPEEEEEEEEFFVLINHKREYNPIILEGILIWMLLCTIGDKEAAFAKRMKKTIREKMRRGTPELEKIILFFSEKTASIEIFNENKHLQKVYFPIHNVTKFLSEYSKKKFDEEVNRESPNDKIKNLLEDYLDFYDEMSHF